MGSFYFTLLRFVLLKWNLQMFATSNDDRRVAHEKVKSEMQHELLKVEHS